MSFLDEDLNRGDNRSVRKIHLFITKLIITFDDNDHFFLLRIAETSVPGVFQLELERLAKCGVGTLNVFFLLQMWDKNSKCFLQMWGKNSNCFDKTSDRMCRRNLILEQMWEKKLLWDLWCLWGLLEKIFSLIISFFTVPLLKSCNYWRSCFLIPGHH